MMRIGQKFQCRRSVITRGLALMALLLLSPPSAAAEEISTDAKWIIADLLDGMNPLLVDYEGVLKEQGLLEQPEVQPELWNELLSFDITLGQLNALTGAVKIDRGSDEPDVPIQWDELPGESDGLDTPSQWTELPDLDDLSDLNITAEELFQIGNTITQLMEQTDIAEEVYQGWSRIYESLQKLAVAHMWRDTDEWDIAPDWEFDWTLHAMPQSGPGSDAVPVMDSEATLDTP